MVPLFTAAVLLVGCADEASESERMAEEHEGDTPTATEATQAPAIPVEGREVTYGEQEEGELTGYLAVPSNADSVLAARGLEDGGALPGLVVIHEWWGLNDNVRAATERLAGQGHRALAIDLYGGAVAAAPDSAQALMQQALQNPDRIIDNVGRAREHLRTEHEAGRVGILGWCFGGGITSRVLASRPAAFDAAAIYYGNPQALSDAAIEDLTTPVLAHFGTEDEAVSIDEARAFRDRMEAANATLSYYEYEAGHAFANPSGERYNADAAEQAWDRTTAFLEEHLYGGGGGQP